MGRSDWAERKNVREKVFKRDGYRCRYCGNTSGPFHADHVYPYSKGGITTIDNLVTACEKCNTRKGGKVGIWPKPIGYWEEQEAHEQALIEAAKPKPYFNWVLYFGITDMVLAAFMRDKSGVTFWLVFGIGVFLTILGFGTSVFGIRIELPMETNEDETE